MNKERFCGYLFAFLVWLCVFGKSMGFLSKPGGAVPAACGTLLSFVIAGYVVYAVRKTT